MISFNIVLVVYVNILLCANGNYNWIIRQELYGDVLQRCKLCSKFAPIPTGGSDARVSVNLKLTQINYLDVPQQFLFSTFWVNLLWHDDRLAWNTSQYHGIQSIVLDANSIWTPQVTILNDITLETPRNKKYKIIVWHNGKVEWYLRKTRRTSCSLNMEKFPYDKQTCSIFIGTGHGGDHNVVFELFDGYHGNSNNMTNVFVSNNEWNLLSIVPVQNVSEDELDVSSAVSFNINIARKPLYYEFNMLLVIVLIELLTFSSYFLPIRSGERILLGISTLLATSFYLDMVNLYTPIQSTAIPFIVVYCVGVLLLVGGATISNLFIIILYERNRSLPTGIIHIFNCVSDLFTIRKQLKRQGIYNNMQLDCNSTANIRVEEAVICSKLPNSSATKVELIKAPRSATVSHLQKEITRLLYSVYIKLEIINRPRFNRAAEEKVLEENRVIAIYLNRISGAMFFIVTFLFTVIWFSSVNKT